MPSILGFSRLQKRQLEELQTRLTIANEAVGTKTDQGEYNNDMSGLDSEDEEHFTKIEVLKEIKADKVEFNSRVNQLTQNDTLHEEQMNTLEGNYATKVSQFEFDKMVAELKASDDSQDARLDALEQQFADIQVRIVDDVKEKANELVKTTDFNAMITTLQHGDTGLHDKIIQLASATSINNALTSYQASLTNLQDKASYNTEINKVVQRNHDFEQRLLGIDQFFRALAETYKLHRNGTEVIYTAEHQPGLTIAQKLFTATGRRVGKVRISLTPYAYNSMTGTIGVVGSGKEVGQSGFNSVTRNGDIDLSNPVAFHIQIVLKTEGGTILETVTLTQQQYLALTNYSEVNISYTESVINKNVGDSVSILVPTKSGPIGSYAVVGSNSLPGTLVLNSDGSITGTATESVSSRVVTIRATSVDGPSEYSDFNITFNIVNNATPVLSANTEYVVYKGSSVSIQINSTIPASGWQMGSVPGLTITNGVISGTPTMEGTYNINISATNSNVIPVSIVVLPNWVQKGGDIDGEASEDYSGLPVSLSADGNTVAIGAFNNDGITANSGRGHVRVYQWNPAGQGSWDQKGGDIDGEASGDYSGWSVSLSADGNTVAIGAIYNYGASGIYSGHVRVYQWNPAGQGSWDRKGEDIDGEASGDQSGLSVSLTLDGNTVAIGARHNDGASTNTIDNRGHVRVYQWKTDISPPAWVRKGEDIDGEASGDESGFSVSLNADGNTVAIGAIYNDGASGIDSGHVRVYQWNPAGQGSWDRKGEDIDGEASGIKSGRSVSLSGDGNTVAIGTPFNDGPSGSNSGHVRVYQWNQAGQGSWDQKGGDIDGEASGNQSGRLVSLSADGNTVAIGDRYNDGPSTDTNDNRGHVRVYQWKTDISPPAWVRKGVDIDGEASGDLSGFSVSLSADGNKVAIGAPYNNGVNGVSSGHTRVFRYNLSPNLSTNPSNYIFSIGESVSIPVKNTGGAVSSWSITGSSNLTITSTGYINGILNTPGNYNVTVTADGVQLPITISMIRNFYNLFPENLNGTVIPSGSPGGYRTLIHTFTSENTDFYNFFFSTLNTYTDVGEFITKVYKVNTTSNMLLYATNINTTNIGITNGTVIFKDPFFNNQTNTSQFSLFLEANTQYYIECVTAWNDVGADVGVSIENNGRVVSISGVSTNTETPEMNGGRSSLSFTTPISAPVRLAMMAPNDITSPLPSSQYVLQDPSVITAIPNTTTTQTFNTPISPVFNNVYYVNGSGVRITSPITLASGILPAITTTPAQTGVVNVSFTPNIFPLSSAFGRVQKYNGASWTDDDFVQSINHNQPITFSGVNITGVEKLRVVIMPTSNNSIRLPASQEFNLIERKFDPLWGKYIDGNVSSDDGTGGVAVDADGNVYLTGHIGDESTSLYDGSTQKPASGAGDGIYLIKYNANGVRQWTRYLDGAGNDRSYNVCCGGTYVYVVGNGGNGTTTNFPNITFPTVYGTKTSTTDGFIAAFGFDNSLGWFRWLAGSGVDTAYGVYTRPGNNSVVYVCGSSSDATTTLDPSMGARPVSSDTAGFLIKLGSDGSFHWGRWIDASGEDACEDIVVDSSGNVYVAGYASGSDTSNTNTIFGSNSKPSTDMDSFIIKYNSSGVLQWGIWMGENVNDKYVDMYISNDNTIYLTGYTTRNGLRRTILDIIDTDGNVLAYNYIGGSASGEHYGNGVVTDSDGYIYLCGVSMSGSNIVSNSTYLPDTTNTGGKGFLIKFNNNMSIVGGIWLGNTGASATARFMTIDSNKNIIVAGNTIGSTTPWSDTSIANVLGNKPDTSRAGYVIKFDQALL